MTTSRLIGSPSGRASASSRRASARPKLSNACATLWAGIQHHAFPLDRLSQCVVDVLQTHEVDVEQRWRLVDDVPNRRPFVGRGIGTRDAEVDVRALVVVAAGSGAE